VLPEIRVLQRHALRTGARVFDLGAHQGVVALMLADAVGPDGRVVAVEASPRNFAAASRNLALNPMPQVRLVNAAVADAPGRLWFGLGLNGNVDDGSRGWGRVEVPAVTIDELSRDHGWPDVLFMDVEGFECAALAGAAATLARTPDCFVEVHVGHRLERYHGSVEQVLAFFPDDRYELFAASETVKEFAPLGADSPLRQDRFFLLAIGRTEKESVCVS
jgi:FkbM family methyltransferase